MLEPRFKPRFLEGAWVCFFVSFTFSWFSSFIFFVDKILVCEVGYFDESSLAFLACVTLGLFSDTGN